MLGGYVLCCIAGLLDKGGRGGNCRGKGIGACGNVCMHE